MSAQIDPSIVYEILKKIQGKLNFVGDDVQDIKQRMVSMEAATTKTKHFRTF